MRRNERGFTLLELALVMGIAVTLMAASLWAMRQQNTDAREQQSKMMLASLRTQLSAYRYKNGAYPPITSLQPPNDTAGGIGSVFGNLCTIDSAGRYRVFEPIGGVSIFTAMPTASYGGWIYDASMPGNISANVNPNNYVAGDTPLKW